MKWTTRSHLHLDRTASAWLIRTRIDPDAQFAFVGWDEDADVADEHVFGVAGSRFAAHALDRTCFGSLLSAFELDDENLIAMERIIAAGVHRALGRAPADDESALEGVMGQSLNLLGVGLGVLYSSDDDHLAAATPLYDALYTALSLGDLDSLELPPTQPERVAVLRSLATTP